MLLLILAKLLLVLTEALKVFWRRNLPVLKPVVLEHLQRVRRNVWSSEDASDFVKTLQLLNLLNIALQLVNSLQVCCVPLAFDNDKNIVFVIAKDVNKATSVGDQVQDALFGKPKPKLANPDEYPEAVKLLEKLDKYRRKFAVFAGDDEGTYRLKLAQSALAMIDAHGTIYIGVSFLTENKDNFSVPIGALAHEIGHRPQRWHEYPEKANLSQEEIHKICRLEETRADYFAGRARAAVHQPVVPIIHYLASREEGPHPEYFPVKMRAEVIEQGFADYASYAKTRKKLWPELEQMMAAKLHIGDF
jgi:hypothetical protein